MRRQYRDPVTGDAISRLEYLVRMVQVVVRTPAFIALFNVITVMMLTSKHGDAWNWFASWLAIMIEWLVGTYMFGQTGRDAVVMREVRALIQQVIALIGELRDLIAQLKHILEHEETELGQIMDGLDGLEERAEAARAPGQDDTTA